MINNNVNDYPVKSKYSRVVETALYQQNYVVFWILKGGVLTPKTPPWVRHFQCPITDSQSVLSLLSKAPSHLWPRPLWNVWFHVSSLSNSVVLTFQWVQGPSGIPGIKNADSLPKAEASLPSAMVRPLCLSPAITKLVTSSITNEDLTFSQFLSHLNCFVPTVYPGDLVLSLPICFELSAFTSKVKAFYYCRKSVVKIFFLQCLWTPSTGLHHLFPVLPLSLYANLALALLSAPWCVVWLLGFCEVCLLLHLSEGVW